MIRTSWSPAPFPLKCPLRQILVSSYNHHTGASLVLPKFRAHIPSLTCLPKVPCIRAHPFNNRRAKAGCRPHSPWDADDLTGWRSGSGRSSGRPRATASAATRQQPSRQRQRVQAEPVTRYGSSGDAAPEPVDECLCGGRG
jgi:hypothetical protein